MINGRLAVGVRLGAVVMLGFGLRGANAAATAVSDSLAAGSDGQRKANAGCHGLRQSRLTRRLGQAKSSPFIKSWI